MVPSAILHIPDIRPGKRQPFFGQAGSRCVAICSPMPAHDQDYRVTREVGTSFLAQTQATVPMTRKYLSRAASDALDIGMNAPDASLPMGRPVVGITFSVIEMRGAELYVFSLGSNNVLLVSRQRIRSIIEPHGIAPWGDVIAEPGKDTEAVIREAEVTLGDGTALLVCPVSNMLGALTPPPAVNQKELSRLIGRLASGYAQFPHAWAAVLV